MIEKLKWNNFFLQLDKQFKYQFKYPFFPFFKNYSIDLFTKVHITKTIIITRSVFVYNEKERHFDSSLDPLFIL